MKLKFHWGYAVGSLGYMMSIAILSGLPFQGGTGWIERLPGLYSNLLHIPLFAGLAWFLLMSVSDGRWSQPLPRRLYALIALLALLFAASDEWYQSFGVGRSTSVADLLLDSVGTGGLLLAHFARRDPKGSAGPAR